jgi:Phage replication protein CRI
MPDTIRIKHICRSLENYDFQKTWKKLSDYKGETWINNPKNKEPFPRLSIFRTPDNLWHHTAEVSLPRLLFGHNARLPNQHETFEGLRMLGKIVEEKSHLPFDPFSAIVSRVDFTKDIQLSKSEIVQIIKRLSVQNLSWAKKRLDEETTLYFKAKANNRQICIYDKFREVLSRKNAKPEEIKYAEGKLRIEFSLFKPSSINSLVKRLGLPDKTALSLLNEDVSNQVIYEVLESLNFEHLLVNKKPNFDILRETFSTRKAMNLCGFLEALNLRGETFYKDRSLGFSKDSYYADVRDCRKAKVWKKPIE